MLTHKTRMMIMMGYILNAAKFQNVIYRIS